MNKDLDDRLIPNGEYRDAQNISVGKSEADDIGALETVLGNSLATNFGLSVANLKVIGYHPIENSNKIIVFLTDNSSAIPGTSHYIYEFLPSNPPNLLVTGSFLNFSQDYPISGISVIEDLLFWTDNNNQPRKINMGTAFNGTYYTQETDISVAKYSPYKPIGLLNKVKTTTATSGASTTIVVTSATGIYVGMAVVQYNNGALEAKDYVYVTAVSGTNITINQSTTIVAGDITFLSTTMTGKDITYNFNNEVYNINTWPGDPDYLESRFVRLSYRFEFDDGEYSIMAPFTPIAFIPKQKGYFLGNADGTVSDDENSTYRSTIVEFMENGVQNVELLIPFPDTLNKVQPSFTASYKIRSLDILYKESDATVVKVLDTINYNDRDDAGNAWTATTNSNIYIYNYQSRKPFRTLPTNQTVRVYDKVPVKALAQETAGNRIIYGNFLDKYTPPSFLRYVVNVTPKYTSLDYDSWAEFPTQSLKQNRNYQVGFVLADKFGRQSDVILSEIKPSKTDVGGVLFGGDTVYSPYNDVNDNTTTPVRDWFGNSLKINIQETVRSTINPGEGTPGLYANSGDGYDTFQSLTTDQPTISGNIYEFEQGGGTQTQIPTIGSYLAGEFTDYVYVENVQPNTPSNDRYRVTTIGQVSSVYLQSLSNPDVKYSYTINAIGWYSYKIVVKQQEQDYYNVYLPGILNGYPDQITPVSGVPALFPIGEDGKTANIILINDNINKVPRDLSEVGPQQKQFRSSVKLFGRVSNDSATSNIQYYPGIKTDTAVNIATTADSNMEYAQLSASTTAPSAPGGQDNLYQIDTNPLVARVSTNVNIIENPSGIGTVTASMRPFLAIYETEPQESLLDIFWETPTVGLLSELNDIITTGYEGAVGWKTYNSSAFTEASIGNFLSNLFPVDQQGQDLTNTTISMVTVVDASSPIGQTVTSNFNQPTKNANGSYNFSKAVDGATNTFSGFIYNSNQNTRNFTITATITNNAASPPVVSNPLQISINLQNVAPTIGTLTSIETFTTYDSVVINGDGISGVNGAISSTLNQDQLQWSMTGGSGYFSINPANGQITQTNAPASTYVLSITVTDANGTGLASSISNQQVVVSTPAEASVGFAFFAGDTQGNIANGVCPSSGELDSTCGTNTYYNTTDNTPPEMDDIISSSQTEIVFLQGGFYSYNCGNGPGEDSSGNYRLYFEIEQGTGKVITVSNCGA